MDVIVELLQIFKKEGLKSAGLITSNKIKTLPEQYMCLVLDKQIHDDDQLAKRLYGSTKSDPKYKNLKKRVKRKLLDGIPMMDKETLGFKTFYNQAYYDCLITCHQLSLLSRISAYETILNIIKNKYDIAKKFQFYDILYRFSYQLVKIYALRGNIKKAKLEEQYFKHFLNESNNINLAHITCLGILTELSKKSSFTTKNIEEYKRKLDELESYASQSHEFIFWLLYTKTYYFMLINDPVALIKHIRAYENVFNQWNNYNPGRLTLLVVQKATVFLQMKEYEKGLDFARVHLPKISSKQNNWALLKRYEFCHAINIDLDKAFSVVDQILKSEYYKLQNNNFTTQLWIIHNAYLQFMLQYEKHPESTSFNLYKFINEVDLYSKDKSGYNFSIIVIELMFYLLNDNIDKYIDKMTALMSYRIRHLKTKAFKRSNVFAQLLLNVDKQSFNYEKLKKSSQKKYEYLVSLEDRLSINEWEIIGYDRLWEIVLDLLEKRKT